jgi:hypothetical protein
MADTGGPDHVHTDFEAAFVDGARFVDDDGAPMAVRVERLGAIDVDGLAVGDPLTNMIQVVRAPAGHDPIRATGCPIDLAVVTFANRDERVAAARLRLSPRPVVRWEQSNASLAIDTGTAGVITGARIDELDDALMESLFAALEASYRDTWSKARIDRGGTTAVAFSSGLGDGVYPAYWGLDDDGAPAALALDFDLLVEPHYQSFTLGALPRRGAIAHPELAACGVTLRRPWWGPHWLALRNTALAKGEHAIVRFRRPGESVWQRLHYHPGDASRSRADLRRVPDGAVLAVKVSCGTRAMRRA